MNNVEQILLENGLEGTPYFVDENFEDAILGYTEDGNLVYSYTLMIEWLANKENLTYEEAQEWINYNTIRTIPYMGDKHPIIVYDLY